VAEVRRVVSRSAQKVQREREVKRKKSCEMAARLRVPTCQIRNGEVEEFYPPIIVDQASIDIK
jgi:hypothetical protein